MTMKTMKLHRLLWLGLLAALLSGCAGTSSIVGDPTLDSKASWVLLPIANNTETPQAALSAEALVEHHLRARGVHELQRYPATLARDSLFEPAERKQAEEALQWARAQGARYAITGSVEEWRYKVGLDGDPVVGLTLRVIDLGSGRVVWSASGSRSGWLREGVSSVALKLVGQLVGGLKLVESTGAAAPQDAVRRGS